MEVLKKNSKLLSNYEVMKIVKETRAAQSLSSKKLNKLDTDFANITYDVLQYLEDSPCASQSPEAIASFCQAMKSFNVTKLEKLQMLNLRPSSNVQLYPICESIEERFSDVAIGQMLQIVSETLPAPPTSGGNSVEQRPLS